MICPRCGNEINDNAKFCLFCGSPVQQSANEYQQDQEYKPEPSWKNSEEPLDSWMKSDLSEAAFKKEPAYPYVQNQQVSNAAHFNQQPQQPYAAQPQQLYYQQPQQMNYQQAANQKLQHLQQLEDDDDDEPKKKGMFWPFFLGFMVVVLLAILVYLVLVFVGVLETPKFGDHKENTTVTRDVDDEDEDEDEDSSGTHVDRGNNDQENQGNRPSGEAPKPVVLPCGVTIDAFATSVDLSETPVDSLEGIENVTGLKELYVTNGTLTDLSPLASLTNLEVLVIRNMPVTDLTPLYGIMSLKTVNIVDTEVTAEAAEAFQKVRPEVSLVAYTIHEYKVYSEVKSWEAAKTAAEELGGHLACITSAEEMQQAVSVLNGSGLTYVWLGGYSEGGTWKWVTGETFDYAKWFKDEPSGADLDGTVEDKLCIWNIDGEWTENDQRNALNELLNNNSLGYLVEFERPSGKLPQ